MFLTKIFNYDYENKNNVEKMSRGGQNAVNNNLNNLMYIDIINNYNGYLYSIIYYLCIIHISV